MPTDPIEYRLGALERRMERIEQYEPAVIQERLGNLSGDVQEVKTEVASLRKVFIGFLVTFAFFGITTTVSVIAYLSGGP